MTVNSKIGAFVAKHGFTIKSWFLAFLICPPAAVYIPFRIRHVAMPGRIAMVSLTVAVHGLLISGSAAVIGALIMRGVRAIFG